MLYPFRFLRFIAVWTTLLATPGMAGAAEVADDTDQETPWPYEVHEGETTLTVYQPQLDSWDGYKLQAPAAVSVREGKDDKTPTFGVIYVAARTLVDKDDRIVTLDRYQIDKAEFPSAQQRSDAWVKILQNDAADKTRTIAL